VYLPRHSLGEQQQFSLLVNTVSVRHVFLRLVGYGNYLAVLKGDIAWKLEPQLCVHNAGSFHAFNHFAAIISDHIAYRLGRRLAAQDDHGIILPRTFL